MSTDQTQNLTDGMHIIVDALKKMALTQFMVLWGSL